MSFENTTFLDDATALCGGDTECLFDALATRNLVIGENTRVTKTGLQDDAEALCKHLISYTAIILSYGTPEKPA